MDKLKILLIGCGKMGSSLLEGIVKSHDNFNLIDVVDPVINDSYKEVTLKKTKQISIQILKN